MPQMITALFRDPAQARQGLQALMEMGVAQHRVVAVGSEDAREISSISGFRSLSARDDSLAALHDLNLPASDLHHFERELREGCTLIAAQVDPENLEDAVRALEMFDLVDLDRDSRTLAGTSDGQGAADGGRPLVAGLTGGSADGLSNTGALPGMGAMIHDGSSLGTADLRTDEAAGAMGGSGSTAATGEGGQEGRENRPGIAELRQPSPSPAPDAGPFQRHMNRRGPVWSYGTD